MIHTDGELSSIWNVFKKYRYFISIVLLILLVSSLFVPIFLKEKGIFHNDQAMSEFMHRYFFAESLQKGIIPLWDPNVWCGANFHYSFSYAGENYYLPLWPFYLSADLDNIDHSYLMIVIIPFFMHYLLAAIGMFILLKKIIKCNHLSSIGGAIVYLFSPALMYSYVCESRLIMESLLPWLIIIYMLTLQKYRWWKLCLGGLVFVFICVAGCPQDMPFIFTVWGGFVIASMFMKYKRKGKRYFFYPLVTAFSILILGGLLSSVYSFSLLDGIKYIKIRPNLNTDMLLSYPPISLSLPYLITLFLPFFYGNITGHDFIFRRIMFWYANMSGGMGVTLAISMGILMPIIFRKKIKDNKFFIYAIISVLLCIFSILCSLGDNFPFYRLFIGQIPVVGALPYPLRYRLIQCFFASVLVAIGINFLCKYRFKSLNRLVPRFILGYVLVSFMVILAVLLLPSHNSKGYWIGERNSERIEEYLSGKTSLGVYTSKVARVRKVGLVLDENSKGEISYSDNHRESGGESVFVKEFNVKEAGWVEFKVDIPPNKFVRVSVYNGKLGIWKEEIPSFIYKNDSWFIQPHLNAISLYQESGPGGEINLLTKLEKSYIEKKPIINSLLYWVIISCCFIIMGYLLSPRRMGLILVAVVIGEVVVFGFMAFYGGEFNEAQTRSREFLPHNVRFLSPSEHPMFRRIKYDVSRFIDDPSLRLATDYPFYDNFCYLTDNYALMGEPAHFLDARFRNAIEQSYQYWMSMGLFYNGGGILPKKTKFLNNFSVGYFVSSGKGKIFGEEDIVSFQDPRKHYIHINKNVLPRVYTINDMVFASDKEQLYQLIFGDLSEAVYVSPRKDLKNKQRRIEVLYSFEELQQKNKIINIDYGNPNEVELDIDVKVPAMLIFSEVWHPGWRAYVDGRKKEVHRVNHCQRGVWLDKGEHHVRLFFKPSAWIIGRNVTLGTLVLIILTMFFVLLGKIFISKIKRFNNSEY